MATNEQRGVKNKMATS
jgi:hypothetical protein